MIGNKISEARKKSNISQAELAQHLFISSQAVGKWERGESMPDPITLHRLAEILNVDLNYFSDKFNSNVEQNSDSGFPDVKVAENQENMAIVSAKNSKSKLAWDMSRGNWVDADFSGLKNLNEKFSSSNMKNCKFIGSDLSGLLLKNNNVEKCDFSNSDLSASQIQNSNLNSNLYIGSKMDEIQFRSNNISKSDFSESSMQNSQFHTSNFDNNNFKNCVLTESEFSSSHIYACDFESVDFTGAKFISGGFGKNKITNAIWNHTSIKSMWLTYLVFEGVLDDCYFENCSFKKVVFQNSKLTNTFFKNKSLKRIQFINCQADRMTYEFLKNGKADLSGITLL